MKILYVICPLPAVVDIQGWRLHQGINTAWKTLSCAASFVLLCAHTLFKLVRLVSGFLFLRKTVPLYQEVVHLVLCAGSVMLVFWYYIIFMKYPKVFAKTVKITLTGNFVEGKN